MNSFELISLILVGKLKCAGARIDKSSMNELLYWLIKDFQKSKNNDDPSFNAFLVLTLTCCLNIFSLFAIINYCCKLSYTKDAVIFIGFVSYLTVLAILYFTVYLDRKEKANTIENYSVNRQKKGRINYWIYLLGTIATFVFVIFYLVDHKL